MDPADISVAYSDTDHGLPGTGPGGSRYTVMVTGRDRPAPPRSSRKSSSASPATCSRPAPHDLEFRNGKIGVKGASGLEVSIAEVAMQAHFFRLSLPDDPDADQRPRRQLHLRSSAGDAAQGRQSDFGIFYPIMGHMCHMPVVEVDAKTGQVSFLDYVAVHDCGTMVNPMTVDGHVRGGTAQGIGTALLEQFEYDADGQLLTTSFQDYLMPRVARAAAAGAHRPSGDALALHRIRRQGRRRRRPHGGAAGGRLRRSRTRCARSACGSTRCR